VVEEASREVEVTGSNHGNRGASRLYAKKCATCQWGLSYKKEFFSVYFRFLRADPENLSLAFLFIFGFYVLTRKTSVLAGDLSARQH
jgi:hypothetical protein